MSDAEKEKKEIEEQAEALVNDIKAAVTGSDGEVEETDGAEESVSGSDSTEELEETESAEDEAEATDEAEPADEEAEEAEPVAATVSDSPLVEDEPVYEAPRKEHKPHRRSADKPKSEEKDFFEEKGKGTDFLAKKIGMPLGIGLGIGGLVVGLLVGALAFGSGASSAFAGKAKISEAELDAPVAVVNYKGKKIDISARDIITTSSSLSSAKMEDGTYDLPSAEFVLTAARDKVLEVEAEARGISVSDEDLKAKSLETLGTDEISAVAETYGIDEETIRATLRSQCIQDKMREQTGSKMEMPEPPTAPDSPKEGDESTATADYAKYIIELAGDEWDADAGKWADPEGEWATTLTEDAGFTASKATYEAASLAYSLAYTDFVDKQTAYSDVWQKIADDIYSNATVSISTLVQ